MRTTAESAVFSRGASTLCLTSEHELRMAWPHAAQRLSVKRGTLLCGVMLALVVSSPRVLAAQNYVESEIPVKRADSASDSDIRLPTPTGCVAAIPPARMHSVPVFLHAFMPEHPDSPLKPQADLLAQDVANEFRQLLGAAGSTVPNADTNFVWYSVPAQLTLMSHRNGDLIARPIGTGGDSAATLMLVRAFEAARARGGALVGYPGGFVDDSAPVYLALWPDYVGSAPEMVPPGATMRKFAVFNLTEPEESPALPLPNQRPPRYPSENEQSRVEGSVLMEFVVDTTGRADRATIHELWPLGTPPLHGYGTDAHEAFVQSVTTWLREFRFSPMRIGECAVKQRVQLPLEFRVP